MSMRLYTIFQFTGILGVYMIMTVLLPAFVLHDRIRERRFAQKFYICLLSGNFYIMNLVFLLQLLHISNRFTLIIGTFVPAIILWQRLNNIGLVSFLRRLWQNLQRISEGKLGGKTVVFRILDYMREGVAALGRGLLHSFTRRWLEWILLVAVLVLLAAFYGVQLLRGYGYTASDTPVHLYWINGMSENNIFIDGVYPFGYHCVIYYLHAVFGIDSYVFMRLFSFVQTLMLHMVLLGFIRLCCRSRYIGYGIVGIYVIGNFLQPSTYLRFFSVLPQEYGMIFILPAIYFAFYFFQERRQEVKKWLPPKESRFALVFFAMSFSMTLAVHFYDTMIAGLFCVGVAVGYLFWFLRKQYFWNVLFTGFISVMIAVLPMAAAYAMGTPLQGSLGWGMSVINGSGEEQDSTEEKDIGSTVIYYDERGNQVAEPDVLEPGVTTSSSDPAEGLRQKLERVWDKLCSAINGAVLNEPLPWYYIVVLVAMELLFLLGILFLVFRRPCYGAMLLSTGVFMVLMLILQTAKELGLPELMDGSRCRIYFGYMLPVAFAFAADGVIRLLLWKKNWRKGRNFCSLVCVAASVCLLWNGDYRKESVENTTLVTNEAITCLTNIIREEKDFTWTICSANDETQMGLDHGYHYELITFLKDMELKNMEPGAEPLIRIPTDSVYIFIEKVPIDYTEHYSKSGQSVSRQGAIRDLPSVGGIDMYKGENRWILMSRIYYWAQAFKQLYPYDVRTYCETDQFVCYKIKQNPYHLFNFAIDYGYNSRELEE